MQQPFADVSETHSAVVYFAGDYAYKLKKPVRLDFLDFSTVAARERACQRETALNRRFAPDVYLGVAEVRDPAGQVCDHLVVMRRMPASRRLSALLLAGEPVDAAIRQVARMLAAQHASATRSAQIAEQGSRTATERRWNDNLGQLRAVRGDLIEEAEIDEAARLAHRFLSGREPLLAARVAAGRIVDGHGDLLAADIFCLEDGPRILDCLDFDDQLRWVDGLDDAAFLAMDLEQLGAADLAEQFSHWYSEFAGDAAPGSLRQHYVAYRAMVRAKVNCLRAQQGDRSAPSEARRLAAAGIRHLRAGAVTLVLVGGPPGTGKSVLAGAVADQLGFTVLGSDRIRKELAGIPPEQHVAEPYGVGIYAPSWTDRTYAEMLRRAGALLSFGESVVLDATWTSAAYRRAAAAAAGQAVADLVQLRCSAEPQLTADRIRERTGSVSDATAGIAAELASRQEPWPEAVVVETGDQARQPESLAAALAAVRPHGPEHVWRPVRPYMLPG